MLIADLERHVIERGAEPCLMHRHSSGYDVLTFSQFADISDQFATAVRRLAKAESSGVVLIILRHHVMQLPLFVGCMKAGLIPCFLPFPSVKQDPALYWKTHQEVVNRSRPALIVTYGELLEGVTKIVTPSDTPVADIAALEGTGISYPHPDEDRIALLQHSSGTTGLKKGVALTYRQIACQVASYAAVARLDRTSIIISWLPYYHDMGLFTAFLAPLSIGATIVSIDPFEWVQKPEIFLDLIQRFHGTHSWMPNFAFNYIVNTVPPDRIYDLSSLRALINCSEPVRAATFEVFLNRFGESGLSRSRLKACYAMAETCFAVSQTPFDSDYEIAWYDAEKLERCSHAVPCELGSAGARPYVSNGPVIGGIDVRILTDSPAPPGDLPAGVPVGEIAVRGTFVFKGYFANDGGATAAFPGEWHRTGDIGFIDEGCLFVTGRKKDILILHGRNYYAHDIEAAAALVAGIIPGRVVALGFVNDAAGSEEAIILAETDTPVEEHKALQREVKQRVYGTLALTPRKVELVRRGWLIKTTSGKISRFENLTRFLAADRGQEPP